MEKLGRFFSGVKDVFDYNGATLSGAVDVLVIRHPDGSLHASPFSVRFGKFKIFKTRNKEVTITVNNVEVKTLGLRLAANGKVFQEHGRTFSEHQQTLGPRTSRVLKAIEISTEPRLSREETASTLFAEASEPPPDLPLQYSLCRPAVGTPEFLRDPIEVFNRFQLSKEDLKARYGDARMKEELMVMAGGQMLELDDMQKEVERDLFSEEDLRARQSLGSTDGSERSFMLTSEQLLEFQLRLGLNEIQYSVSTRKGDRSVIGYLFLFESNEKLVISDIDGTITRSNVLGHVLPKFNKDWSQKGVCQLFGTVVRKGYKFVYLTARAIGQSQSTRDYIASVRQGDISLPMGPIITSPYRLFASFVREVITHRSESFKADMLRAIAGLFPENEKPLYAGFGNSATDAAAYRGAGIPEEKIFIVDNGGKVRFGEEETNFSSMYQRIDIYFEKVGRSDEEEKSTQA